LTQPRPRAPGRFQKLNSAQVPHPSRCLSIVCQVLPRAPLLGISPMPHLPLPPPRPALHVPRHRRDHPSLHSASSIQNQPNVSAHQNFTCAPCAQPLSLPLLLPGYGRAAAAHHARTHHPTSLSPTPTILHPLPQGTGSFLFHPPHPICFPPLGPLFLRVPVLLVQTFPHPLQRKKRYQLLPFRPSYPIFFTWGPISRLKSMSVNFRALACAGF
jgi:hypothetical protein